MGSVLPEWLLAPGAHAEGGDRDVRSIDGAQQVQVVGVLGGEGRSSTQLRLMVEILYQLDCTFHLLKHRSNDEYATGDPWRTLLRSWTGNRRESRPVGKKRGEYLCSTLLRLIHG